MNTDQPSENHYTDWGATRHMRENRVIDLKRRARNGAVVPLSTADESATSAMQAENGASSRADSDHLAAVAADNSPVEHISSAFLALDSNWRVTYVNGAERLLGRRRDEALGLPIWEALPHLGESALRAEIERAARERRPLSFETTFGLSSELPAPTLRRFTVRVYPDEETSGLAIYFQEVTDHDAATEPGEAQREPDRPTEQTALASGDRFYVKLLQQRLEALVEGQSQALEMISQGSPLAQILEDIARWVEAQSGDEALVSLLLLDPEGQRLLHGAAPSLSEDYNAAIHGIQIGPAVGSCGTAAFTGREVIVEDIASDPLWADYRELALAHGLRACWSTPLIGQNGSVLGAFALYYRQPRLPSDTDRRLVQLVTRTATLAIEHKQAEEERERLRLRERQALRQVEAERQRLYDLFMEAPAAIAVLRGPDHVFELANPLARQAIGLRRDVLGKPIRDVLPELEGQGIFELLDQVYATGEPYEGQDVLVKLDRSGDGALEDTYFTFVYRPTRDETGAVDGILAHAVDVTDSLRARQLIEASEARYRTLFDLVPVAVYSCDAEGVIQEFNQQAVELWGREPKAGDRDERYCGSFKIFYPDGRFMPHNECPMARVLRGESVAAHETEILVERPDGQFRNVVAHPRALTDESGVIIGAINCLYDITDRKRAEAAVGRLAAIVTSAEDAIASKTLEGVVTSWNASAERMFGYTAEEMIGQPILRLFPPDRLDEEDMILARIRAGERIEHFETVRMTKDGRPIYVSLTISPIRDSAGAIIGASKIVRDITERKRAEDALRESAEKFRTLADNIPTLAWMARADGHIFWYNQRWYEYTGTTPETQEGWGWQSVHDPDELPAVMEQWRASLASGEPFEMVFPLRGADGVFRPFLTRIVPIRDEQGRVVRWFGTNTDVSDLRAAEEALRAANQRMDEFLHTATHELKTPLTALQASLQIVERRLQRLRTTLADDTLPQATRDALEIPAQFVTRSQQQARRLTRLVNDLVDAARIQAGKLEIRPAPCDLAEIVWEAVTEQRAVRPERLIELDMNPEGLSAPVMADADRIGQAVTNYLTNALKYSPEGVPVEVSLRAEGETAEVRVRDEGPGIPAEALPHIWERGYRVPGAQPTGEGVGLGLGLHISRELIERHGGAVGVESAPGEGSAFWFTLPLSDQPGDGGATA